ncbi:MAG: glycosyltransferase, partial [Alphaproteobacteria bacterium]
MAKETAGLKIAVVRPFFTLAKGGAEYYAVELVKALIDYGHGVHVFAHQWDRPEEERVVYHRVAMVRKPAW